MFEVQFRVKVNVKGKIPIQGHSQGQGRSPIQGQSLGQGFKSKTRSIQGQGEDQVHILGEYFQIKILSLRVGWEP